VIRLWDVDNKQELGYIPESHTAEITNMIFLPDRSLITVGSACDDHIVRTWDIAEWIDAGAAKWQKYCIRSIDIFPDCRLAATCCTRSWDVVDVDTHPKLVWPTTPAECAVSLWDLETGKIRQTLRAHDKAALQALFNHDGSMLASCHSDAVFLWSNILEPHPHAIATFCSSSCMAWSPGGEVLACGNSAAEVSILNGKSGALKGQVHFNEGIPHGRPGAILGLTWLSDCTRLAVAFSWDDVMIVDTDSWSILMRLRGSSDVFGISYNNINMLAMYVHLGTDEYRPHIIGGLLAIVDLDSYVGGTEPHWERHCHAFSWHKPRLTPSSGASQQTSRRECVVNNTAFMADYLWNSGTIHLLEFLRERKLGERREAYVEVASFGTQSRIRCMRCAGRYIVAGTDDEEVCVCVCVCVYASRE
jgi:WD40 repeat protein